MNTYAADTGYSFMTRTRVDRSFAARDGTVLSLDDKHGVFNYVVRKIEGQGERCMTSSSCAYRSDSMPDAACAIGWLVPDELIRVAEASDENSLKGDVTRFLEVAAIRQHLSAGQGLTYDDMLFLKALQLLHDRSFNWENGALKEDSKRLFAEFFLDNYSFMNIAMNTDRLNAADMETADVA
jgi:hypothetical protein